MKGNSCNFDGWGSISQFIINSIGVKFITNLHADARDFDSDTGGCRKIQIILHIEVLVWNYMFQNVALCVSSNSMLIRINKHTQTLIHANRYSCNDSSEVPEEVGWSAEEAETRNERGGERR